MSPTVYSLGCCCCPRSVSVYVFQKARRRRVGTSFHISRPSGIIACKFLDGIPFFLSSRHVPGQSFWAGRFSWRTLGCQAVAFRLTTSLIDASARSAVLSFVAQRCRRRRFLVVSTALNSDAVLDSARHPVMTRAPSRSPGNVARGGPQPFEIVPSMTTPGGDYLARATSLSSSGRNARSCSCAASSGRSSRQSQKP
jgi:hypothetical protein